MAPKKQAMEEMILRRLDEQDEALRDIKRMLKGDEELGIVGVIPSQKQMSEELKQLMIVFNFVSSKRTWQVLLVVFFAFTSVVVWARFGFDSMVHWLKSLFVK